jgi:hypothetical protein
MRVLLAPIMAILFLAWVFYIAFITKTIKKHKTEVSIGFFFLAVWGIILVCVF